MNALKACSFLVAASAILAGCSSTPPAETAPAPVAAPVAPATTNVPMTTGNAQGVNNANSNSNNIPVAQAPAVRAYLDPNSPLTLKKSVYFDFDKFDIKSEYTSVVEVHGKFLASASDVAIKVEGNADERGSKEYNLALGQKRADSVVRALKTLGVKDSQLEAVSWGEEKPKATGHDEAAWSQNRRADLVYPVK